MHVVDSCVHVRLEGQIHWSWISVNIIGGTIDKKIVWAFIGELLGRARGGFLRARKQRKFRRSNSLILDQSQNYGGATFESWNPKKGSGNTIKLRKHNKALKTLLAISRIIFIRPRSDHSLPLSVTHSLTDSLTHCCLVNLMPVNIAVLTRVRSLAMLVTHSLPNSLTPVSKLDLCEPDMWRWQLKTCWSLLGNI